jgi:UDP-N-acetylmuramyl pentapeptide phosphotransferase/UDP-N-acetylglucosamine-1-phosphate transferase
MILSLITIFSVLNFFLFFYYKKIATIIKIYDIADSDRKSHKGKVPVLGGTFLLVNLLFISIIFFYNFNFYQIFFNDNKILFFFLTIFGFYLLGIIDDSLKPNDCENMVKQYNYLIDGVAANGQSKFTIIFV